MSTEKNIPDSGVASVTPEKYIHDQLDKARTTLKRTKIAGSVLLLVLARIIHECPALLCLSATFRFNAPFMTGTASADQDGHLVYGQFARNF